MQTASIQNPCCVCAPTGLQARFIIALKSFPGSAGFVAPYETKYLKRVVTRVVDGSGLTYDGTTPLGPDIQTYQTIFTDNQFTAGRTSVPSANVIATFNPFPFFNKPIPPPQTPLPLYPPGQSLTNYFVDSDTQYRVVSYYSESPLFGVVVDTTTVTLSQEYTRTQMDADTDTLINQTPPSSILPGCVVTVFYVVDGQADYLGSIPSPFALSPPGLPGSILFPVNDSGPTQYVFGVTGPIPPPNIKWPKQTVTAACGYSFDQAPNNFTGDYDRPGGYYKMVGYFRVGQFALQNIFFDVDTKPDLSLFEQFCFAHSGGTLIKVAPPTLDPTRKLMAGIMYPGIDCNQFALLP